MFICFGCCSGCTRQLACTFFLVDAIDNGLPTPTGVCRHLIPLPAPTPSGVGVGEDVVLSRADKKGATSTNAS